MLEVGQVLSLRIRFNNNGLLSRGRHPYLILSVSDEVIEIAQLDSLEGKEHKAAFNSNKVIYCDEPIETVIDKDSYVQLDNKITLENFDSLTVYRRQEDKLSSGKLHDVLAKYQEYHANHHIDELKIVYMDKDEILSLNP